MPVVAALPAIASTVGAGASLYSALNGNNGSSTTGANGTVPTGYQPTGQAGADSQYQALMSQLLGQAGGLSSTVQPAAQALYGNVANNPYSQNAMDFATGAQSLGQQVGNQQIGGMSTLMNQGDQAFGYGNQIMNTAMDPQNALYDRTSAQTMNQQNALNAMNGVSSTPYGAGVSGDAQRNFNIDWQNNQLQRQATGAQAYDGLASTGQGLYTAGSNLGTSGLSNILQTGMLPYQTYLGQQGDQLSALGSLNSLTSGSMAPSTSLLSSLQQYLNLGQGATKTAQTGQSTAFNQNQTQGANLGSTLGGLATGAQGLAGLFGTPAPNTTMNNTQTYNI